MAEELKIESKQAYLELQMIEQQIKQMQKQLQVIESQLNEIRLTKQSLEDISDVKLNSEMLVPLASGIFVKGVLKDTKEFIVNVGSNTAVKKNKKEVIDMVDNQLAEILKMQNEFYKNLQHLITGAKRIENKLAKVGG